jgi:23S rRNA (guanosine2251-2'-O)-methyltransferase
MKKRHRDLCRSNNVRHAMGQVARGSCAQKPASQRHHDRRPDRTQEIIFGLEPVFEMIAADPSRIRRLYLKRGAETRFERQIEAVRDSGGEVLTVESSEFVRMAGSEARHQGIIATLREYSYAPLERVLASKPDPLLIIDGVTDPRNLGAILRSAECAGLCAIVLAKDRTAGITPAAIKSSAGAWVHLAIARCGNVARTLESLKEESYWIVAMDANGDTPLYDLDVSRRLALVLGSEGEGIRDIVRKTADFVVRIPLYGRISSLNVSIAAAIALFEVAHRRATEPTRRIA